jgi:hypothetical protein
MNGVQASLSDRLGSFLMPTIELFRSCNQLTKVTAPKKQPRTTEIILNLLLSPLV